MTKQPSIMPIEIVHNGSCDDRLELCKCLPWITVVEYSVEPVRKFSQTGV